MNNKNGVDDVYLVSRTSEIPMENTPRSCTRHSLL